MNKKTVEDIDLKGKKVLMRVDFNIPLDKKFMVSDDTRIKAAIPTIKYILQKGGKLILMSHLGRPDGKVVETMRMKVVGEKLSELLGEKVNTLSECLGTGVTKTVSAMKEGDVVLLENLRFHPEEEANNENFAKELAGLGDVYVNDAFGTCHRAHASTEGVAMFLPAVAGFLMKKEIEYFDRATKNPDKPYVLILGGAKVSDKIGILKNLMSKVDKIIVGGGMAYTFLDVLGFKIGKSKLEVDRKEDAKKILEKAKELILPQDHIATDNLEPPDGKFNVKKVDGRDIPEGWMGVDIGPKTITHFKNALKGAKTIVWNGPLGIFEKEPFANGTKEIAKFISTLNAVTIIGGGDTAAAISKFGLEDKVSHVSTGGGASLEYLEGKVLPGIAVLADKK